MASKMFDSNPTSFNAAVDVPKANSDMVSSVMQRKAGKSGMC